MNRALILGTFAVFGLILALIWAVSNLLDSPAEAQAKYQAWCKVYATNITFKEWDLLRQDNLLPGQNQNRDEDLATGMAIGIAVAPK